MWKKLKDLFEKKQKTHKEQTLTMTKKWIGRLLSFGCIWITWSYVLATIAAYNGNYTVCENLSRSVVQFVVSTILGYMLKSYFETHSEEHNKLVMKLNGLNTSNKNLNDAQNSVYFEETSEDFMNVDNISDLDAVG